jgi:CRISPR-associated endonuclease Csn1
MTKNILGLDLGTNSIGWALIEINHKNGIVKILGLGSRILPMDAGEIGDFERSGKIKSTAAQRTEKRGSRRLNERYLLRRDRLHLVLDLLDALPKHYKLEIDFTNEKDEKCGQFKKNKEPKLAYLPKQFGKKATFLFSESYQEMLDEIGIKNKKKSRIPYDWTLYFLRQKALSEKISLEELAWVLLSYNQKRGYEKTEVEDKSTKEGEIVEELDLRVNEVVSQIDKQGNPFYEVHLEGNDNFVYKEYSDIQMTFKDDLKEIIKTSKVDEQGNIDKLKTEFAVVDIYPLAIKNVEYENKEGKHIYTLTYQNGWKETKQSNNYTFRYKNALDKKYDYIVETVYDYKGEIKTQQGKERKLREPDLSDNSNDWTLLKKKTEKEALSFNIEKGYKNSDGSARSFISPKIYDVLKNDAQSGNRTKIIGGLFQVVDRDFYREELRQIINAQKQFHTNLDDKNVFEQCVKILYPKNKNHQEALLKNKDAILHLLVEDILMYQRPLKSKKSEIANCKYEIQYWKNIEDKNGKTIEEVDIETGEIKIKKEPVYRKVVSASHPYFQEFRIWDKLHSLRLIQLEKEVDGKKVTNQDITKEYFKSEKEYQKLFEKLNNQKSFNQHQFLTFCKEHFKIDYKAKDSNYVWNFPEDEELKGNETRVSFATRFKRCGFAEYADFLTQQKELELWHYLYSVSYKERTENNNKSVTTFFNNYFKGCDIADEVREKIINDFANYPKFASKYCAYSEKALKKFLPIIRLYKREETDSWSNEKWYQKWQESIETRKELILKKLKEIDFSAEHIDYSKVINTSVDVQKGELPFPKGLFNVFRDFEQSLDFSRLNLTQASYLIYGRHSELAQAKYWTSPDDIRKQLHQELKQHSLNNPVAEKVLLEMMQVVADLWDYYGKGEKDFFSKIHLEVGRELKKSAKEKEAETKRMSGNKSQNKRLRQLLEEYLANNSYNANPKNFDHFERLRIVEEGAEHTKNNDKKFFENKELKEANISKKDIDDILKKPFISKEDFEKYKLWIEQGYRSPYSGQMIKLTELFDGNKFNIDHIFPQASITNNSLSNKVVVEVALNKLKSDKTARAFIQSQKGQPYLGIPVCSEEIYLSIVKTQFSGTKKMILLSKEIPKGFTSSQLNNSRHIARKAMELLSHIVREPGEVEFRSKNVLPVTGMVTTELKKAWKLDQVWTELVAPRFIRLNELTQSNLFGSWQISKNGQKYFDCNLDSSIREKDESYDIKRIDHRHHALDALVVALCTEDHVNYINNINADAKSDNFGKQKQIEEYRQTLKRKIKFTKKDDEQDENNWYYMLPGEFRRKEAENSRRDSVVEVIYQYKDFEPFGQDYKKMVLTALQNTIVTFKQNLRIINKTVNRYNNSSNKNKFEIQNTNNGQKQNWSIRRSLGKGTFYSKIDIGEREKKQLLTNSAFFYSNIDAIANDELRNQISEIKKASSTEDLFKKKLKEKYKNITVECIAFKIASRFNSEVNTTFTSEKINTISDTVGRTKAILLNQLKQFDTVELLFNEAVKYFELLLEKQEFEAIVNDTENEFYSTEDFLNYLKKNNYKYKKVDYSKLNVFIDKVPDYDFRNDIQFKDKIKEHPEIAFTPDAIEEMNKPENISKLNDGKSHKPVKKVTTYTGYGKQRAVSESLNSVKSKQYVVNDSGTNIYISFYELSDKSKVSRKSPLRLFKEINIFDLINFQKNANTFELPIEETIFSEEGEKYDFLFTLSQNDTVKFKVEDKELIYAFNRFTGNDVYFRPINHASEIDKNEVDLKPINPKTGKNSGSQTNETTSFNGEQIKNICWKLNIDRLGNISKA